MKAWKMKKNAQEHLVTRRRRWANFFFQGFFVYVLYYPLTTIFIYILHFYIIPTCIWWKTL